MWARAGVCRHGRWDSTGQPTTGERDTCHNEGTAHSLPSHPGEVTSHAEDRIDGETELPAQGPGVGDAVQEQWLQTRERQRDLVLHDQRVPAPRLWPHEPEAPGARWGRAHLLPVGCDHTNVTGRHLARGAPGQEAAVTHDLHGFGWVEPRWASPFTSFTALS